MAVDVTIPALGESITEVVLTTWHKSSGEWVEKDESLYEVESDKITTDVPASESGILTIAAEAGSELEVGAVVAQIDTSAAKPAGTNAKAATASASTPSAQIAPAAKSAAAETSSSSKDRDDADVRVTSVARKIAQERGVALGTIEGTGPSGRITKSDVLAAADTTGPGANGSTSRASGTATTTTATQQRVPGSTGGAGSRTTRNEKMSKLRQRIAERLVFAKNTTAMLTTFNECDMSEVLAIRAAYKEQFSEKHGVSLGFMSFFVKACCAALSKYPRVNASIEGDMIEFHDYVDVSIAVSTPKGLTVPNLRNAESLSFAEIEAGIKELAIKARDGKLTLDDLQGGTFTITNGGVFGSLNSTPILNPPQSGILGMHKIMQRPVEHPAGTGQIALRPMMYLALSYDHRIVDGAEAVGFLVHVKECIEDPKRLMLEV